jgi:hypothetical protein
MGQGQSQPTRPRTDSQACKKQEAAFDEAKTKYETASAQFEAKYGGDKTPVAHKDMGKDMAAMLRLYDGMDRAHKALTQCQLSNGMVPLGKMPKKPKKPT